jgi:NAD(P)-dependent dehydrogenase (short-subunit alcohol dehydrogenase family)
VIATDVDATALESLAQADHIIPREMDVTSNESVEKIFREVKQEFGGLDLIINNAGVDRYFPLSEAPLEAFKEIFEINLFGAYRVNQIFLPLLKSPGGRIIHIGSESYHLTLPFMPYPLTKRAVESYARALRIELKFRGIDVVVVRPGPIRTNFIKNLSDIRHPVSDPALKAAFDKFTASVPGEVGRLISPEKAASFIYRVSRIAHPRSVYRINNSFQLRFASILPFRILEKIIYRRLT